MLDAFDFLLYDFPIIFLWDVDHVCCSYLSPERS